MLTHSMKRVHKSIAAAVLLSGLSFTAQSALPTPMVGLLTVSQNTLLQSDAPTGQSVWRSIGEAYGVTAMAGYKGQLYVTSNNRLWRRDALGANTGNQWTAVGEAYGVVALAAHQGQLYAVSGDRLWQRGAIGPDSGNDWSYVGDAIGATALVSFQGQLYMTSGDHLWVRGDLGPTTGNDWIAAGSAYGVTSMAAYRGRLYALSANRLWQRGAIGRKTGNHWSLVADANGMTVLATAFPATATSPSVCESGCDYNRLTTAVDASPADAVIQVGPGTYKAHLVIGKNLTLNGSGKLWTTLVPPMGKLLRVASGASVSVRGISAKAAGTLPMAANLVETLGDLTIADSDVDAVSVSRSTLPDRLSTLTVSRSNIEQLQVTADWELDNTPTARVSDSFVGHGTLGGSQGLSAFVNSTVESLDVGDARVSLQHVTVHDLTVSPTASLTAVNTLFAAGFTCDASSTVVSLGHNLAAGDGCDRLTQAGDRSHVADLNLAQLTQLGPESTKLYPLASGSAAIDAGDCHGGSLTYDQRGLSRPQGARCDIGAFEFFVDRTIGQSNLPELTGVADDQYTVGADRMLLVPNPGVQANDPILQITFGEGRAIVVDAPVHGQLTLNPQGGFAYQPNPGFTGEDQFTYRLAFGRDGVATTVDKAVVRIHMPQ